MSFARNDSKSLAVGATPPFKVDAIKYLANVDPNSMVRMSIADLRRDDRLVQFLEDIDVLIRDVGLSDSKFSEDVYKSAVTRATVLGTEAHKNGIALGDAEQLIREVYVYGGRKAPYGQPDGFEPEGTGCLGLAFSGIGDYCI